MLFNFNLMQTELNLGYSNELLMNWFSLAMSFCNSNYLIFMSLHFINENVLQLEPLTCICGTDFSTCIVIYYK